MIFRSRQYWRFIKVCIDSGNGGYFKRIGYIAKTCYHNGFSSKYIGKALNKRFIRMFLRQNI